MRGRDGFLPLKAHRRTRRAMDRLIQSAFCDAAAQRWAAAWHRGVLKYDRREARVQAIRRSKLRGAATQYHKQRRKPNG